MNSDLTLDANTIFKGITFDVHIKTGILFGIKKFISLRVIGLAILILKIPAKIGWIKEVKAEIGIEDLK